MTATLLYDSYRGDALNPQGSVVQSWLVDKGATTALSDADLPPVGSPLGDFVSGSGLVALTLRVAERPRTNLTRVEVVYGPSGTGGFGPNPDEPDAGVVYAADTISYTIVPIPVVRVQTYAAYSVGGVLFPLSFLYTEFAIEKTLRQEVVRLETTVSVWTFSERQSVAGKIGKLWQIGADKYLLDGVDAQQIASDAFKLTYSLTTEPPLLTSNAFFASLNTGGTPTDPRYVVPPSGLFPMLPFERLHTQTPTTTGGGTVSEPTYIRVNKLETGVGALVLPGIPGGYLP